jgi:hypothetical protein
MGNQPHLDRHRNRCRLPVEQSRARQGKIGALLGGRIGRLLHKAKCTFDFNDLKFCLSTNPPSVPPLATSLTDFQQD